MVPYGTEVVGMQRDWNEELQSCREFSRDNLQDRWVFGVNIVQFLSAVFC
jgi:protein TIF31